MRALLVLAFVLPACASTRADVRFHATEGTYDPYPREGSVDVFVDASSPEKPFRVVGLIVVNPSFDTQKAARLAASTAQSLGCDLITMRRDHAVAQRAPGERILVASWGSDILFDLLVAPEPRWGSGGSRGEARHHGESPPPADAIDPKMRKFWCGKYVAPRLQPDVG